MKTEREGLEAYFDRFVIDMTEDQARAASHAGDCMADVQELLRDGTITEQLDAIGPDKIRAELKETGGWDDEALQDDDANRGRIVWLAAGHITEDLAAKARRAWEPVEHDQIAAIVGRCHVGDSMLSVVREVIRKMPKGRKGWLQLNKSKRRYSIAASIQHHAMNRIVYRQVMERFQGEHTPRYWYCRETQETEIRP